MKNYLLIALVAGAMAVGCKKQGTAVNNSSTPAPDPAADSAAAPAAAPTAPTAPVATPVNAEPTVIPAGEATSATLARLTKELHRQIARTHQLPSSFEDLVAKARLQVPPPPPGKKYALSSDWKVILVNR